MPAIVIGPPPQCSDQMWQALKKHIINARQRKKQEQEADAEEERQRKERERQQKLDVMTLGETREQITSVEEELSKLKDEKHQLFSQLKKVLHDDNRRRQIKETNLSSEMIPTMGGYIDPNSVVHPQMFLPIPARNPLYKVAATPPTHNALTPGAMKRQHTPSPPPTPAFHTTYGYKPPSSISTFNPMPLKPEDAARRSGDSRAVLWNKNNQYPASTFYSTSAGQNIYSYSTPKTPTAREAETGKIYMSNNRANLATHPTAYVTTMHPMEHKGPYQEDKYYPRPSSHVTVHGGAIPIQQPPQGAKTGGITSGYPVRTPQPPQPGQYPPPPQVTYVSDVVASGSLGRMAYSQCSPIYLTRNN